MTFGMTSSSKRASVPKRPKAKGRPRLRLSPAAGEIYLRVQRGLFADELLAPTQRIIAEAGSAVDDVDACYREALPDLVRILAARNVPDRDRDALDHALRLYKDHRPRGQAPLKGPSELMAQVNRRLAGLVAHLATIEQRHPDHRPGEACVVSVRPAPAEDPDEAIALRMYLIEPRGAERRAAVEALRRILWRAAQRLGARGLLTTRR